MIEEIKIMIELQRFWDNVLMGGDEIKRSEKSISLWKERVEEKRSDVGNLVDKIKNLKKTINQKEVELTEKDEKSVKLDERKNLLKSEKEVTALEHELQKVNSDKNLLEEELIQFFDELEENESTLIEKKDELDKMTGQADDDIKMLNDKLDGLHESIEENNNKFNELVGQLTAGIKSRFLKIIKSATGKAIVTLEDDNICDGCHFEIPVHTAIEVAKENQIVNCTNCGRFIYKQTS